MVTSAKLRLPSRRSVNWYLLFLFELIPLIVPDGLGNLSGALFTLIYRYWQMISYGLILFEFVFTLRKANRSLVFVLCLAAGLLYLAMLSFVKGAGLSPWYSNFSVALLTILLVYNKRQHLDRVVLGYLSVLEFWIYLNFLCMLLFPGGMYKSESNNSYLCWLLGYKSSFQYYILPAVCFSLINLEYRNKRVRTYLLLAVCIFSTLHSKNSMLTVGLALILFVCFFKMHRFNRIFCMRTYLIAGAVANALYIFATSFLFTSRLGASILLFFGKTTTLSGRATILLPRTLSQISDNLFLGHGVLSSNRRIDLYGGSNKALIHSHNQVLEVLFIGGIVLFMLYILLHLVLNKKLMQHQRTPASQILSISIFSLIIMMLVEVYTRRVASGIWCMMMLCYFCGAVDKHFRMREDICLNRRSERRKGKRRQSWQLS